MPAAEPPVTATERRVTAVRRDVRTHPGQRPLQVDEVSGQTARGDNR